jgi:hypothetical protein
MRHNRTSTDTNDENYRIDKFSATLLDVYSSLRRATEPSTPRLRRHHRLEIRSAYLSRGLGRIGVRTGAERWERPFDE